MALSTYNDVLAALPAWTNRKNTDAVAPDLVALAHAEICAKLRDRRMHYSVDASVDCGAVELPRDFLEIVRVYRKNNGRLLTPATLDQIVDIRSNLTDDVPYVSGSDPTPMTHFALRGNIIEFAPSPTANNPAEVTILYFARPPTLTGTTLTNWVLEQEPLLYLYGSLKHAAPYLMDDERIKTWEEHFDAHIARLNVASRIALHSGGSVRRRRRGFG